MRGPRLRPHPSRTTTARLAGLLYLVVAITSGFAAAVRSSFVVPGDAAATAGKIVASGMLFRLNIVSDLAGQTFHVFLALALYRLLESVDEDRARLMLVLALVPVPIAMLNQLNQFAALQVSSSPDHAQLSFFLGLHAQGILIAQVFWGLWLFPLGYLVFRSGFIPRILGILLVPAGLGYLVDSIGKLTFPGYDVTASVYTFLGEVLLLLWLLVIGARTSQATLVGE